MRVSALTTGIKDLLHECNIWGRCCKDKNLGNDCMEFPSPQHLIFLFYFVFKPFKNGERSLRSHPTETIRNKWFIKGWKNDSQLIILGIGRFPSCDPWGQPFSKQYYPHRMALANQRIAGDYVAVLEGIQGDQDYIRILFSPERCHEDWYSFLPQKI